MGDFKVNTITGVWFLSLTASLACLASESVSTTVEAEATFNAEIATFLRANGFWKIDDGEMRLLADESRKYWLRSMSSVIPLPGWSKATEGWAAQCQEWMWYCARHVYGEKKAKERDPAFFKHLMADVGGGKGDELVGRLLRYYYGGEISDKLIALFKDTPASPIKVSILRVCKELADAKLEPIVVEALDSEEQSVLHAALQAAGAIRTKAVEKKLVTMPVEKMPCAARIELMQALGATRSYPSVCRLLHILDHMKTDAAGEGIFLLSALMECGYVFQLSELKNVIYSGRFDSCTRCFAVTLLVEQRPAGTEIMLAEALGKHAALDLRLLSALKKLTGADRTPAQWKQWLTRNQE